MLGNTRLVDYGIQTEKSDIRAHVCVLAQACYVYETKKALPLAQSNRYHHRSVFTGSIKTATGFAVPVVDIPECHTVNIPDSWMKKIGFSKYDNPSEKGEKAVKIVSGMVRTGRFPLMFLGCDLVDDEHMQISGTDILISLQRDIRIQVKCDYKGGIGMGCTGNLFLQVQECNPLGYT